MYQVAIIGAGQLGSRHLQGLKTASLPFEIWVMDKSIESLNVAKQRYEQVEAIGEKQLHLTQNIEGLPQTLDFVVVATGSMPRASLVKTLLAHSDVKYMILEKVLFPKLEEYDEIGSLIKEKGVKTWVNCARRMFGVNHEVARMLDSSPISMIFEGTDWGLCCNSIHLIDLFLMFANEDTYTLDTSELLPIVENSKRKGYIEFYGALNIRTPKGSSLRLVCHKEKSDKTPQIDIIQNELHVIINEGKGVLNVNGNESTFRLPFQSETTGTYADMLLKMGHCSLTPFEMSTRYHKVFIGELLNFYNKVNGTESDLLPIT